MGNSLPSINPCTAKTAGKKSWGGEPREETSSKCFCTIQVFFVLKCFLNRLLPTIKNIVQNLEVRKKFNTPQNSLSPPPCPRVRPLTIDVSHLSRYSHNLSKFLCGVYEGLMMRPPRELLTPSKLSSDDESPIRRSVNSNASAKQDSNQPR